MAQEDAVGGTQGTSRDVAGDILKRLGWDESSDGWDQAVVQRDSAGNLITTGSWHSGRYPQDGMRIARVVNGDEDMLADVVQMLLDRVERAEEFERQVAACDVPGWWYGPLELGKPEMGCGGEIQDWGSGGAAMVRVYHPNVAVSIGVMKLLKLCGEASDRRRAVDHL